ncbi:MAG: CsbD family protein [Actinomycetota bacterium]|nr:CsbD family protein [Actinomycetota bacterium]
MRTLGAFEEVKGKVKQVAGDLTDDDELRREGKAQERKGEAQEEAAAARARARAAEAEAIGHELEQDEAQRAQ